MSRERYLQSRRVTILGAIVNIILGSLKIIFGISGNSTALIADGMHSVSDLVTDALVIFAMRFGSQDADLDHPYGHGRIETAATMFLAIILAMVGGGIAYQGLLHIIKPLNSPPAWYTLLIVIISLLSKEVLYHYTLYIGKKITSELLIANAWHHRSDAASSAVVLVGIAGALWGWFYLDAVAAMIVGLLIVKMAWKLGKASIAELIDTGVDAATLGKMQQVINTTSGIVTLHQLRTRKMGSNILLDVHILVSPRISVSEGHHISVQMHRALLAAFPEIKDVTVHVDPEDDEIATPCLDLPARKEILPKLQHCWRQDPELPKIDDIKFHYLDGKIELEIILFQQPNLAIADLEQRYRTTIKNLTDIAEISVLLKLGS